MKIAGVILAVFGGLMVLSSIDLALTKYNWQDSNDASKAIGGFGISVVILAVGVGMVFKKR